jgi:hypothetical protein
MSQRVERSVERVEDLDGLEDVEVGDAVRVQEHPRRPDGVVMRLEDVCQHFGRIWVEERAQELLADAARTSGGGSP